MDKKRCLIADKMHDSIVPMLKEIGLEADYKPDISRGEIIATISNYEALIIRSKTEINAEVIDRASRLKFVARAGAGIDQLDVGLLKERNIAVINAPEGNRDAVAEHAIGMLLCLFNNILQGDRQIRDGVWDREGNRGIELKNKTVGLIGYGNMGRAFAARLKSFGCSILAYDKYVKGFGDELVKEATLQDLFEYADVLSLHIPLTKESSGMFNNQFVNSFKKPFYFINTARGEIAPFASICEGLETGRILGAALDVLEDEKINRLSEENRRFFNKLAVSSKVILSPHVAGWTFESYERINKVLVDKIKRLDIDKV